MSKLTLVISELNSTNTQTWDNGSFITSNLSLSLPSNFSNINTFDVNMATISCY